MPTEQPSLDRLTQWQIAVLAIYGLGGSLRQDSEDVAVRCHELAPGKFGWRKYPRIPSLAAVNEALNDARRERNGTLISGDPKAGWVLTPAGVTWSERHKSLLELETTSTASRLSPRQQRTLRDVQEHRLRLDWQPGDQPADRAETAEAVLLSASAPVDSIKRKLADLTAIAALVDDEELSSYLEWLKWSIERDG